MRTSCEGFTLIEILAAVAIFGLLSLGAYTVLDAGMKSRQQTETRLNQLEALQRAVQTIEKDLRMLSTRQVRDEYGDKLALFRGQSELSGQQGFLEFTRTGWRNPAGLPRSNLQHLIYSFEKGTLKRLHTVFLDQTSNSPKIIRTLLENVQAFNLKFMDEQKQWHSSWSMVGGQDSHMNLPRAVRLTLELEPFGKVERLINIMTSSEKQNLTEVAP